MIAQGPLRLSVFSSLKPPSQYPSPSRHTKRLQPRLRPPRSHPPLQPALPRHPASIISPARPPLPLASHPPTTQTPISSPHAPPRPPPLSGKYLRSPALSNVRSGGMAAGKRELCASTFWSGSESRVVYERWREGHGIGGGAFQGLKVGGADGKWANAKSDLGYRLWTGGWGRGTILLALRPSTRALCRQGQSTSTKHLDHLDPSSRASSLTSHLLLTRLRTTHHLRRSPMLGSQTLAAMIDTAPHAVIRLARVRKAPACPPHAARTHLQRSI